MKQRRISFALGLTTILFAFLAAPPAEAYCEGCRPVMVCWNDCYIVDVCLPMSFPRAGSEVCIDSTFGYCYTTGDLCQWTDLTPPPFLRPLSVLSSSSCS